MAVPSFEEYVKSHPGSADAWAYLEALLNDYGLGTLSDFAQDAIVQGYSTNEVVQRMRTTDTYKKRFKVIEDRKAQGLPAVSEAEVVSYEKAATQRLRSAGLPSGFWDEPDDFYRLQMADVSLAELDARINQGYVSYMQAPDDVRDEWERVYGLSVADGAAYFLDPDRTEAVLTQRAAAAQRAAEAARSGFGQLDRAQAEQLAKLGVTAPEAAQGFGDLVRQRELMDALPGEDSTERIGRDEQLAAAFGGDIKTQQDIAKRGSERVAAFKGGSNYAANRTGMAGIGTAQ